VIDNASSDASLESIQGLGNRVAMVRNSVNRGFAAAVNQGFQATKSAYVLILNPDLRATPDAVQLLEGFLDGHSKAAAVGGYVGDKYLPKRLPTVGSLIRENLGFRSAAVSPSSLQVEQPAAAALLVRRAAYDELNGFDEQFYPAWYEDVDFCRRLKTQGWEVYFLAEAKFLHEGGYSAATMGRLPFLRSYYGNQLRYARKHFGGLGAAAVRASAAAGLLARMVTLRQDPAAYARAFIGALAGWR
jgi:GT2 family glycosyltransferase